MKRTIRLNSLKTYVLDRLAMELTPEQISGRRWLEQSEDKVSVETIYAWIYCRRGRRTTRSHKELPIPNFFPIHTRPTKAHLRSELGHREAGLVHVSGQLGSTENANGVLRR